MLRTWSAVTALLLVLVTAGCTGGGDGSAAPPPTAATAATPEASVPVVTALPAPVTQPPLPEIPLDARLQARIQIAGDPDWLGAGFGSIWVRTASGIVARVDPASNQVIAEIEASPLGAPTCLGLGVGAGAVWTCDEGDIVRIDPATNAVTATIPVGKTYDQGQLPVAADRVWVLVGDGSELVGIDAASNQPGTPIPLGTRCTDVAAGQDALWAACPIDGRVLRIDPAGGSITGRVDLPQARALGAAEDAWVTYEGGLAHVDGGSLEVLSVNPAVSPGLAGFVSASAEGVWVRQAAPFLRSIDPATGLVTEQVVAPDLPSGGCVLVAEGAIWATAYDNGMLVRLLPAAPA